MDVRALVPTTGDRPEMLVACLVSLGRYVPEMPITLVGQGVHPSVKAVLLQRFPDVDYVWEEHRRGACCARLSALRHRKPDVWISMDDDLEALPETNYVEAAKQCLLPGVGLVSTNWARSEAFVAKKRDAIANTLKRQPLVFTGGGLAFNAEVAALVLDKLPPLNYVSDNVMWSLTTYTNGYHNYRHLGSLAIHRAVSKGGRAAHLMKTRGVLPPPELVQMETSYSKYPFAENNHKMPSRFLAPAHTLHKEARATRGWE